MLLRQVKANIIHSDDSGSVVEIRQEGQETLRDDVSRGESQNRVAASPLLYRGSL